MQKKVLVVGATGIIGSAVINKFMSDDVDVVGVSRRPLQQKGMKSISVDLTNKQKCNEVFSQLTDITHVVYTALYEKPNLTAGWLDEEQIRINREMLENVMEPLEKASSHSLQHVTLLQGTKAYGGHVRPIKVPAKEVLSDAKDLPNFYWEQQKYIENKQHGKAWTWTILRPQIVIGEGTGSPMNLISAIGVYGAMLKEQGLPLHYPGTQSQLLEVVDADIVASAIAWAGESDSAQCEIFNVANGDVFQWESVWDAVADALGMEPGDNKPIYLEKEFGDKISEWDEIRKKYQLTSPQLREFVGQSFQFADRYFHQLKYPLIVSTVKIRNAGFYDFIDSEQMIKKWFKRYQEKRLLPPVI